MEWVLILYLNRFTGSGFTDAGSGGIAMETFKNEAYCKSAGVKAEAQFKGVTYLCVPRGKGF